MTFGHHYPPDVTDRDINERGAEEIFKCVECGQELAEDDVNAPEFDADRPMHRRCVEAVEEDRERVRLWNERK